MNLYSKECVMGALFLNVICWIMGVNEEVNPVDDLKARGKCRVIKVEENIVKVQFLNKEDAEIFADNLKKVINNN